MKIIKKIIFDYHLRRYVRQMPFYMIRHFGIKDVYLITDVDYVLRLTLNQVYHPDLFEKR